MKQICWITSDYFVDCDFNEEILSIILRKYYIHWIILLPTKDARFKEQDFITLKKLSGLSIEFLYWNSRSRSPKMISFYNMIYRKIKQAKADLIYLNEIPNSPYILPLIWRLDKNKTIFVAHDGSVKPSFKYPIISKMVFKLAYGFVKHVNMFSITQYKLFISNFKKVKVYIIPLALKNYGISNKAKREDNILFLFFGSIHTGKNLGLLIDAACSLHEKGVQGYKISINGYCSEWKIYQEKIRFPEIFELNIRKIENAEIPDLFAESHYMVFPYSEMSQSGAIKVAFNYNLPVIVSDLPAFKDEVENGVNGYLFRSEDIESLVNLMKFIIKNHQQNYKDIRLKTTEFNASHYSSEATALKYIEMFKSI